MGKIKYIFVLFAVILTGNFLFYDETFASANGLVIDEIQTGKTGASNDEYFSIFNSSSFDIKLDEYSISRKIKSGSSSTIYVFPKNANKLLKPSERIYFAQKDYQFETEHIDYSTYLSSDNVIYLKDNLGNIVDKVGYGDALDYESSPIPNISNDEIYKRINGIDTDNNSIDFKKIYPKDLIIAEDPNIINLKISELYPNPSTGSE